MTISGLAEPHWHPDFAICSVVMQEFVWAGRCELVVVETTVSACGENPASGVVIRVFNEQTKLRDVTMQWESPRGVDASHG